MIEFMVLGGERSATTWAANWLTTERLCIHDPLLRLSRYDLDTLDPNIVAGVSCTALPAFPEFVNNHPARKVILHREPAAIAASLERLDVNPYAGPTLGLDALDGYHLYWANLFERKHAQRIYQYLLDKPWTEYAEMRWEELVRMNVQTHWRGVTVDKAAIVELTDRIKELLS